LKLGGELGRAGNGPVDVRVAQHSPAHRGAGVTTLLIVHGK
jgi:hypothetical protein